MSRAVADRISDFTFHFDVGKSEWEVGKGEVFHPRYIDVFLGFRNYGRQMVVFSNLSFGMQVVRLLPPDAESVVFTDHQPPPNVQYVMTDQAYLYSMRVDVIPGFTYRVDFTIHHAGVTYSHSDEKYIPIPDQPYPSWVLDDSNMWSPPKPYPEDSSQMCTWDEASLSWVPLSVATPS